MQSSGNNKECYKGRYNTLWHPGHSGAEIVVDRRIGTCAGRVFVKRLTDLEMTKSGTGKKAPEFAEDTGAKSREARLARLADECKFSGLGDLRILMQSSRLHLVAHAYASCPRRFVTNLLAACTGGTDGICP
jgi:hypothetical protein